MNAIADARPETDDAAPVMRDPGREDVDSKQAEFAAEALPHLDLLFGLAMRWTGGREERAKDLVQETTLRAFRAWDTYENGTNCKAWLREILRNALINMHRKRSRRRDRREEYEEERHPAGLDPDRTPATPSETFFFRYVDDEVREAVDELGERFRSVVIVCDLMGCTYGEAAEALDIPEGTVKSRLFRAHRRLRERLEDYADNVDYL